jgi:hypothetical protein
MLKKLARISLAATAVAAAMSLSLPAALAAGTWTVTGGPNLTGTPSPGTVFTFTDTTSGLTISCTKAVASGSVINESGGASTAVGTLTLGFSSCTGPLGSTATITQVAGTTITINASSYNSTTKVVRRAPRDHAPALLAQATSSR